MQALFQLSYSPMRKRKASNPFPDGVYFTAHHAHHSIVLKGWDTSSVASGR